MGRRAYVLLVVALFILSCSFMTVAWYGHLKFARWPMHKAILLSWAVALAEYAFMVPGDAEGLADLLGGPAALGDKLDAYFLEATMANPTKQLDLTTGNVGGHGQGNEPGHHVPYLYNVAERPWRVAETLELIDGLYGDGPDGLPGNDDVGQTSAWFAWSALGLYPVDPCGTHLHIGKPKFSSASLESPSFARPLAIVADESCALPGTYVHAVWLDDRRIRAYQIAYDDLVQSATLAFACGDSPANFATLEPAPPRPDRRSTPTPRPHAGPDQRTTPRATRDRPAPSLRAAPGPVPPPRQRQNTTRALEVVLVAAALLLVARRGAWQQASAIAAPPLAKEN